MGGAHILVVDDEGYFRSSVVDALTGQGHRISRAEDVPSALAVLQNEFVDLVVAGHVMPGLSGLAVAAGHHASSFRFVAMPFDPRAIRRVVDGRATGGQLEACSA